MGRHDRDDEEEEERDRRRRRKRREDGESEENRSSRKTKEYVEREGRKRSSSHRGRGGDKNDEDDDDDALKVARKEEEEEEEEEDEYSDRNDSHRRENRGRRRSDDGKRSRGRRRHDGGDGDVDERKRRKRKRREDEKDNSGKEKRRRKDRDKPRNRDDSDSDEARTRKKKEKKKHRKKERKEQKSETLRPKSLVDKSKLYPLGEIMGRAPKDVLDSEKDYFSFHQHLWVYLYREEGTIFGDLSSEEARESFRRFCSKYNNGELEQAYYEDVLPSEAIDECKTTRHTWNFQTNETERRSLHLVEEGVRKQTEYDASKAAKPNVDDNDRSINRKLIEARSTKNDMNGVDFHRRQGQQKKTAEEVQAERISNRRLKEHVRATYEELSGGKRDGRERQLEIKREKAAKIHGAAKDREFEVMGGMEMNDGDIYGSTTTDFKDAVARERQRAARRKDQKETRIAELQQKELDRQQSMLKALGLTNIPAGQKITIKPRQEN